MNNNFATTVIKSIAATQDGKKLKEGDHFSDFITARIETNRKGNPEYPDTQHIDVEDLICDFNYMINQLKKALVPLIEFDKKHATV